MIPSLPLDVQGGIKGGLDDVAVNPLRLAALAASPFCFAKRGGRRFEPGLAGLKDWVRGVLGVHLGYGDGEGTAGRLQCS